MTSSDLVCHSRLRCWCKDRAGHYQILSRAKKTFASFSKQLIKKINHLPTSTKRSKIFLWLCGSHFCIIEFIFFSSKIFGLCTADPSSCLVHATYLPRTKWSFYDSVESLDQLILSLNERGCRENALKTMLLQEKDKLVEGIQKCFFHRLDHTRPDVKQESETRKSTRQIRKEKEYDINLYFPSGTPVETVMERTLVDMILETEEKVFVGGLGSLKVI